MHIRAGRSYQRFVFVAAVPTRFQDVNAAADYVKACSACSEVAIVKRLMLGCGLLVYVYGCNGVSATPEATITNDIDGQPDVSDASAVDVSLSSDTISPTTDDTAQGCRSDTDCTTDGTCILGLCNIDGTCRFIFQSGVCDDGDPCTVNDACTPDACVGEAKDCEDGDLCTLDACSPVDGSCVSSVATGICDDGNLCTTGDRCTEGGCLPTAEISCDDGNGCTADICDPESGTCIFEILENTPCTDGDLCTVGDLCIQGTCTPGVPAICDDENPCTTDTCNPIGGQCTSTPNSASCDDGDDCTVDDKCFNGSCAPGEILDCSDDNDCTKDACVPGGLSCIHTPINGVCEDGNLCTFGDTCAAGQCQSGAFKLCSDSNPCTSDTCVSSTGECKFIPQTGVCSDGNPCTLDDLCMGGNCVSGPDKICDDTNPCTIGTCGLNGVCTFTALSGQSCNDGDACTVLDACDAGVCAGNPIDCDDKNPCTEGDSCDAGVCQQGAPVICDDNNPCTADECIPTLEGGCTYSDLNDVPCVATGNACATGLCSDGDCIAAVPVDCTDDDPCTVDSCDDQVGCVYSPTACDNVACLSGQCAPGVGCDYEVDPTICNDGITCSLDSCIPGIGCQVEYPQGCCNDQVFTDDFENNTDKWNVIASNEKVKWQVAKNQRSVGGLGSLYYGDVAALNYETPFTSNNGKAVSAPLMVPTTSDIWLRFYVWLDVEADMDFDKVGLRILPDSKVVWNKGNVSDLLEWDYVFLDLTQYAGQEIQLQFEFSSGDSQFNTFEGVYIDEIQLLGCN
ncbi:MAG: hypothetical protein VX223_13630 [Myxococcota bacterium]|nr:hypothetical protein [Myxococcota bacterium]